MANYQIYFFPSKSRLLAQSRRQTGAQSSFSQKSTDTHHPERRLDRGDRSSTVSVAVNYFSGSDSPFFSVKYICRECRCFCHAAIFDANTSNATENKRKQRYNSLEPRTTITCRRISTNGMQDKEFPARYMIISHSGWPIRRLG